MDLGGKSPRFCNRNGASGVVEPVKGVNRREEAEGEKEALLPSAEKGGAAAGGGGRRRKVSTRRVQWNDRNGHNLVEVLEFQPSDSSDSDEEFLDSCICTMM